jgi:hypothetical protein
MEEENQEMRKEIEQLKQEKIKAESEFKNKMDVSDRCSISTLKIYILVFFFV